MRKGEQISVGEITKHYRGMHAEHIAGEVIVLSAPVTTTKSHDGNQLPDRPITFEEFVEWLDEDTYAELVDGVVVMMAPAEDIHQDISDFIVAILRPYVEMRQLGWLRSGPILMRTAAQTTGREPDITFVRQERAEIIKPTYLDGPADVAVEIVSPESDAGDRGDTFVEYETAGVREYWLIDPLRQQAAFYQLGVDGRYAATPLEQGIYRSTAIDGFWLRVEWLWQRPLPQVIMVLKELGII